MRVERLCRAPLWRSRRKKRIRRANRRHPRTAAYSFPNLAPGTYDVVVTLPGFRTFATRDVTVNIGAIVRVDARLALGSLEESVVGHRRSGHPAGRQRGVAVDDHGSGARESPDQRPKLSKPADAHSGRGAAQLFSGRRHQQPVTVDAGFRQRAAEYQYRLPPRRHVGHQSVDSRAPGL